ncbi:class I SAM-dependent methyltransferase [Sphingobacteriales bacterium UPWRP_1]|mgnify:CR=1 FL=1|nr:hypothetical protein B6N25_16490 [Sphingobacteriales bacterium TSM_CSS]PSJ73724.1 class I SAM-dependent methyltransferase [Sphingobacteriales bacterium UPWRP_1]
MNFKDYFSTQSDIYAKYRPGYPDALYDFLLQLTPDRLTAWDCATGNGQVAVVLAQHFTTVFATDASPAQINHAAARPNIHYSVATAENSGLASLSTNLITVAQALHWFNFDAFYTEVRRVGKPGSVLAVWGYELCEVTPAVDAVFMYYYNHILAGFWAQERMYVENRYTNIPFPFNEVATPLFYIELQYNFFEFCGYLNSWSATQKYRQQHGQNPLELVAAQLLEAWGNAEQMRFVRFPVFMRAGFID